MFEYWKKIDVLNQMNRVLLAVIMMFLLIIGGLFITLMTAPKHMEFWLAPNLTANGGLIKSGEVPDEYVHGFVSTLLPTMNTWSTLGKTEFTQNLQGFYYYFTPRHHQLMHETLAAFQDAQLFNRTQIASLYRFMEPGDIQRIGHDAWDVHVLLRITQRLNDKSPMVIADKVVDYHVRVVKVTTSKLQNPFQLALDGYTQPEILLHDLLEGEHHDV
ncbi:MAG TPA: hypothetical protein DDY37_05530 [Legionella sp.]|nr:hypothetical protein [Legionella sp.]